MILNLSSSKTCSRTLEYETTGIFQTMTLKHTNVKSSRRFRADFNHQLLNGAEYWLLVGTLCDHRQEDQKCQIRQKRWRMLKKNTWKNFRKKMMQRNSMKRWGSLNNSYLTHLIAIFHLAKEHFYMTIRQIKRFSSCTRVHKLVLIEKVFKIWNLEDMGRSLSAL